MFRAPAFAANLAVSVGTGMHLAAPLALITTLAGFGLISPAVRGGLLTSSLLVYYMCVTAGRVMSDAALTCADRPTPARQVLLRRRLLGRPPPARHAGHGRRVAGRGAADRVDDPG